MSSAPTPIPATEAAAPGAIEPSEPKRKRILLVAGDGFTRLVLLLRLRLAGFAVDFTSNGVLGLGKLRTCHPDILLVELRLCGLSGLELIKAARAETGFGNRPIYVFTYADKMNRTTRQDVGRLATKVFDKSSISREDLVQTFVTTFLQPEVAKARPSVSAPATRQARPLSEIVPPGVIEEIVSGVREQTDLLNKETGNRASGGGELLSRVSSLASCAEAARLPDLARQATALENFLKHLAGVAKGYTDSALSTVTRAVEVMSQMSFEPARQNQGPARFSAVLVDEASRSNQVTKDALVKAGFEPICFTEPARAREYLASNKTQLIYANVRLPEAHGLALADIRSLPLHAETPVLYSPEFTRDLCEEELPTSAHRLDKDPVLLAETVVKALNAVQGVGSPAILSVSSSQNRSVQPAVAAAAPFADGFDLFAEPASQKEVSALPAVDDIIEFRAVPADLNEPNHFFTAADIPNEPIFRAGNGSAGPNEEPELHANLPENTFEGTHTDEFAVEAVSPTAFHIDPQQPPEPEQIIENQAAISPETIAETASQGEIMNNRPLQNQFSQSSWDTGHIPQHVPATPEPANVAEEQTRARCAELEQEIATLRQVFEDFNGNFGQQQQASDAAGQQIQELEFRLNQSAAELEKEKEERQRLETELQQQIEAAKASGQPLEAARQEAEARYAQLEQELGRIRQARDELANKLAQKEAADGAGGGADESGQERQIRQGVAALARATAELAKERGERQRSQQRAAELNERLQAMHEDLKRTLQAQHEDQERITKIEEENHQTAQELERRTADVEQQQAERELAEAQLKKEKDANAQLRKDLSFFEEANKKFGGGRQELQARLESTLAAARESETRFQKESAERQRLTDNLEQTQRDLQTQTHKRETLEQELKTAQETVQDRETRLQKETAERQRLAEALRAVQGNPHDGSERALELDKLQSNLELEQVERKRQETQLARIRQKAVDAAHSARALRTSLRRQIREPVDNLALSARSLLESELGEEQKQLAEALLQDALLVQTRLREPDSHPSDASDATD
jgi:DNA-binding response OmpR family regulator